MRKLNPLLRLAVISGVEQAVTMHVRRGDDLDARDSRGATPLILAAERRSKGVVRVLLDAGANPALVDSEGRNALAYALAGGCQETIALLTEALAHITHIECGAYESAEITTSDAVAEISGPETAEAESSALERPLVEIFEYGLCESATEKPLGQDGNDLVSCAETVKIVRPEAAPLALDDTPLDECFMDDWEPEVEAVSPDGDESVAVAVMQVHQKIGRHKPVDGDEDWSDFELYLPERAAPFERKVGDEAVRSLLLAGLREGVISENALAEVCSDADGTPDMEAEKFLAIVAGELGVAVVEWTGADEAFHCDPTREEETLLDEAMEFASELASGRNAPFRFYSRDIRGDLLEAKDEIALGREMEEAGRDALEALARWPDGLSVLFEAADRVARGEADAESFSTGPGPSSDDESTTRSEAVDENDEDNELDSEAAAFLAAVDAVRAAGNNVERIVVALNSARLMRGFLADLAVRAGEDQAGTELARAVRRQSIARERMIVCNLRLAVSIAGKHRWSGLPFDDLVQEANIGLMKAVERYDWRRGFRFSTYATWWIRQEVTRYIANTSRIVRAPIHIQQKTRRILRERDEIELRLGRPESVVETARRIGMNLSMLTPLLNTFEKAESLDLSASESEIFQDDEKPLMSDIVQDERIFMLVPAWLDQLNWRQRDVISRRYGLRGFEKSTLEEVAKETDVTRERVRQIQVESLRRLRNILKVEGYTADAIFDGDVSMRRKDSAE